MEKYITDPRTGLDYELVGDYYLIAGDDELAPQPLGLWGRRRLAYEINREVQGYYVYLNFAAPGKTVDEIERIFRIDDRVLRYLTVKLGDAMNAETIEAEKARIAEAAAQAAAKAAAAEGEEFEGEAASDDETTEE